MTTEPAAPGSDLEIVRALRAGDETAFMMLVDRYQPSMLRIARMYVSSRAVAEEVVGDAWVGVLRGLDGFEGRSSLRTWIFRILVNIAKTRGQREARSVPFSSLWVPEPQGEASVEPERFLPPGDATSPGLWADPPAAWDSIPEARLEAKETLARIAAAIEALPPNQREVIRLRDVLGWTSKDVRNALEISETNQRVLLHRAREGATCARGLPRGGGGAGPVKCSELVELVTAYLEGALPEERRGRFEEHVQGCGGCTAYLEQFRTAIRLTGMLSEEQVPADARKVLLDAFRVWSSDS